MQLILTHLFRPKWQHPQPEVRKKAVGNLDPGQETDQSILETIARQDPDCDVRCQALKKLGNPDCLAEYAANNDNPRIQQSARNRLCELVTGLSDTELPLQQRLPLLDQLEQSDYLLHIALKGDCFEIRQEAVLRLRDEDAMVQVINNADNRQLRQLAAEGVCDPERLQQLIRSCRQRDKGVYRTLKNRLDQQRENAQQQQRQRQAQEQLCMALEKLAEESVSTHYGAKLQGLKLQWSGLPQPLETVITARFDKAVAQCQLKADRYAEELAERQQQAQARAEQARLLQALEAVQAEFQQTPPDDTPQQLATMAEWSHRWIQLAEVATPGVAEDKQWQRLHLECSTLLQAWQRYQQFEPQLRQPPADGAIDALLQQLEWPDSITPPTLLIQLQRRRQQALSNKARASNQPPDQAQWQQPLQRLEQALDQGQLSAATDLIRPLRDQNRHFSREQRALFKRLNARYQELQGWQKFATNPKLEQCCAAMEQLAEATLSDQDRAEQLRDLQQQWKQLDGPQVPNALRQRFQQANDHTYAACQDFFEQQRQQRQQNLTQRQRLCEQLDALLQDSPEAAADVRALQQHNRELRSDWRRYSPVERGPGKQLQKRFNRGLKTLDALLDKAREDNGLRKQALVEEAAALAQQPDSELDSQSIRELQQRWKQIGPTRREQESTLWQRFREHCDALHQRITAQRAEGQEQARSAATALCEQLERTEAVLQPSVVRLQQQFEQSVAALGDGRRLQRRFNLALAHYQLRLHPQQPDWPLLNQIEGLCQQAEKPLLDGASAEAEPLDTALQLASQLSRAVQSAATQRVTALQQLRCAPDELEAVVETSDQALRLLCIRLEILRGQASPEPDQALRMEYQMSRLQDALQQDASKAPCIESMMALQREWLTIPFNAYFAELNDRFNQLIGADCGEPG